MKNLYKVIVMFALVFFATSCEEELIIFNGEAVPHFTASSASAYHGAKTSADTYSIEIGTTTSAAITVNLTVDATSTAIEGVHYETLPASVSIGQGEFVTSLVVTPLPDAITPGEPVTLVIDIANSTEENQTGLNQRFTLKLDRICNPMPGDYRVVMHDSYGDGWQTDDPDGGSGIQVTVDGVLIAEVGMCSPYLASNFTCVAGDYFDAEDVVTIPIGSESAEWYFPGDYYGEISFEIYGPDDSLVWSSTAGSSAGLLTIVLCDS